ncbi:MAG: ribonuclease E activity regulator RraA [Gammaproteobacteria bacterium]|nr:ribonuclease E activity regulator RraA [Gammaproteobacteria bacterium]MCP5299685.1 ribonuclease E activity regulator RraA [Chromatiaceae bacterium]
MSFKTADLCDEHADRIQICDPEFTSFGGRVRFHGPVSTIRCFEDNSRVREAVGEPGHGRVLVVDAGGSRRCAMLGDLLAAKAVENGWSGVVMNGMIRDSADIAAMDLGVKALGTHPLKSVKRGVGERDVPVRFAGVTFTPGGHVYADEDGVICSDEPLIGD